MFDAFLNFSNRGCNVPTTGEDMARSKLLRIGRISQDHPSRVPKHPRSFDLFQRWQRQRANLIQFLFFFMMTTIWSRTAISKALPNLTFIDMETFFQPTRVITSTKYVFSYVVCQAQQTHPMGSCQILRSGFFPLGGYHPSPSPLIR